MRSRSECAAVTALVVRKIINLDFFGKAPKNGNRSIKAPKSVDKISVANMHYTPTVTTGVQTVSTT